MNIVRQADLESDSDQAAVLLMLNEYAQEPMGAGKELPDDVQQRLIPGLRAHPTTLVFLAFVGDQPVGIATCFYGYSTFAARPLINISDLYVRENMRGSGLGKQLLEAVETAARESGCCKLTLEVQENNRRAQAVYQSFGFSQAVHVEESGGCLFLSKPLD